MIKPTAIGCYVYAGGFTSGMTDAGILTVANFSDGFGDEIFSLNFPAVPIVGEPWDIFKWDRSRPDIVYGNPPCAVWSPASTVSHGQRKVKHWSEDPRMSCWDRLLQLGLRLRPSIIVGESVPQFFTKGWAFSSSLANELMHHGYSVTFLFHDVKFLGGAQQRRRVFLIGHRVELRIPQQCEVEMVTPAEVLANVQDPGELVELVDSVAEIINLVPVGGTVSRTFDAYFGPKESRPPGLRRPSMYDSRLDPTRPTGAIIADRLYHPTEGRKLGVLELAALMGYPDEWDWGDRSPGFKLGRMFKAVTPYAGRYLGGLLRSALTDPTPISASNLSARAVYRWAKSTRILDLLPINEEVDLTDEVRAAPRREGGEHR